MQNDMTITISMSKLKPEVKFQYGDGLFSETGSDNISSKFGMQIDFDLTNKCCHWTLSQK